MNEKSVEIIQNEKRYCANNYASIPVVIKKGKGVWVKDVEGNKYLDMLSSYSALNQGHRHPKVMKALYKQAKKLTLTSRAFYNDIMGDFLSKICRLAGYDKALPMNTGTEAVETAIKIVRKWGHYRKNVAKDKGEIIVCSNNFHGRTITIVSFSTEDQYRDGFGPFPKGFSVAEYGNADSVRKLVTPNTIGILAEPIQGEGGVIVPPEGYLKELRQIADENKILLILDEIQTGFGRTGKMFCYEHEGIKPDVLILGKALSAGIMPVSLVLTNDDVMSVINPGDHGSTFGGNPLGAAVGIASIDVLLDEELAERSNRLGNFFIQELRKIDAPCIKEIRGKGLLIGVEIKVEFGTARKYCMELLKYGVLCKETHDQTIRFAPPLVIKKKEIEWALEKIKKVLTSNI